MVRKSAWDLALSSSLFKNHRVSEAQLYIEAMVSPKKEIEIYSDDSAHFQCFGYFSILYYLPRKKSQLGGWENPLKFIQNLDLWSQYHRLLFLILFIALKIIQWHFIQSKLIRVEILLFIKTGSLWVRWVIRSNYFSPNLICIIIYA